MQVLKGFRYRAYPNEKQWPYLRHIAGCCRLLYNLALEQRSTFGGKGRRSFRYEGQRSELKALKTEVPFLKDVPHHCLQETLIDLQKAFENFFAKRAGYPNPRRKFHTVAFRFPDSKQFTFEPSGDGRHALVRLPKMGKSKGDHGALLLRLHRPLMGKVKSLTVVLEGDECYVSVLVAQEIDTPQSIGPSLGVDRGVVVSMMRSDGVVPYMPTPTPRQEERYLRLCRDVTRKKKGSKNRSRSKRALARYEAKHARRRRDAVHKATTSMARNHRRIVLENLKVCAMTASARGTMSDPGRGVQQKAGLNRAIRLRCWGMMRQFLAYKCAWYGSELRFVPPSGTSQTCSVCGFRDSASRVCRDVFCCSACKQVMHADLNAARVICGPEEPADDQPDSFLIDLFGHESVFRGPIIDISTPEDKISGSACGDLCVSMSVKQELTVAIPRSFVLQGEV